MTPEDIARIEQTLAIRLPLPYREALLNHGLEGDDKDHPEFKTEVKSLLNDNVHFLKDPEDLSDIKKPGLIGAMKFAILYKFRDKILESRRKRHDYWVKGQRFLIGDDQSEERYFIILSEASPSVYGSEVETGSSWVIAHSVDAWLTEVKQLAADGEDES